MYFNVHGYQGYFSLVTDLLGNVMKNAEGNGRRRNLLNASASNKNFAMTKRLENMNVSEGRASMLALPRICRSPSKAPHNRRDTHPVPTNLTLIPLLVLMVLELEVVPTATIANTAVPVVMTL